MDHYQKNDKTESARGLGRKTREEIGKGNQNDSLKIPDRGETSDITGHPSRVWLFEPLKIKIILAGAVYT